MNQGKVLQMRPLLPAHKIDNFSIVVYENYFGYIKRRDYISHDINKGVVQPDGTMVIPPDVIKDCIFLYDFAGDELIGILPRRMLKVVSQCKDEADAQQQLREIIKVSHVIGKPLSNPVVQTPLKGGGNEEVEVKQE
jgi:hypothetical protein